MTRAFCIFKLTFAEIDVTKPPVRDLIKSTHNFRIHRSIHNVRACYMKQIKTHTNTCVRLGFIGDAYGIRTRECLRERQVS